MPDILYHHSVLWTMHPYLHNTLYYRIKMKRLFIKYWYVNQGNYLFVIEQTPPECRFESVCCKQR